MANNVRSVLVCVAAISVGCGGGSGSVSGSATVGAGPVQVTAGGQTNATVVAQPTPPPPPPPQQMAHLRVIHASPEPMAGSVSIFIDSQPTPVVPSVTYRSAAGYLDIPAGAHTLSVRPAGAPASTPAALQERTPPLVPDRYYTVIAHGLAAGTPGLSVAATVDDSQQPAPGSAHVRFFHALAGMATVDVCLPNAAPRGAARPIFANVAYGIFGTSVTGQGAYAVVPSGQTYTLQVRAMNRTPCTGAIGGTVNVSAPDRAVVTAIAIGNPAGTQPMPREMLVCQDAPLSGPSGCVPVPIAQAR